MKKKILVYVDAENVSFEQVSIFLSVNLVKCQGECFGKVFSTSATIGDNVQKYASLGLEFIDTTYLQHGSKNSTDMKLTVDVLSDVLAMESSEIGKVVILSRDSDFYPLALKLSTLGITVELPFSKKLKHNSMSFRDVNAELNDLKWYPLSQTNLGCLRNQFGELRKVLGVQFTDEVIYKFLEVKQKKILKAFSDYLDPKDLSDLLTIPPNKFDFYSLKNCKSFASVDTRVAIQIYTLKAFGRTFSNKELDSVILQVA